MNPTDHTDPTDHTVNDTEQTTNNKVYNIEVDFGDNKVCNFRKWKGKERRLLQKIIENESENNVEDVLVYNCMEDLVYLTQKEIVYVIFLLYSKSFGGNLALECSCNICGNIQTENVSLDSLLTTSKLSAFKDLMIDNLTFKLANIMSLTQIFLEKQNATELGSDKLFNEICIHCNEITKNNEEILFRNFGELQDFIDELPIENFDKLVDGYVKDSFTFVPIFNFVCTNEECKQNNITFVDIVEEMTKDFFL
jgi:hypothetical protein